MVDDPVPPPGEENVVDEAPVIPPRVHSREEKTLRAEINGHKRVAERNLNPSAGKTKIPRAAKGAIDKSKIAWGKLKTHVLADIKAKSEAQDAL